MKKLIVLSLIFAAVALVAAESTYLLPVWTGRAYAWLRLGPTLTIANGQIDAVQAPPVTRAYGVRLTYDATAGGWTVPASRNLVVWVNGLRYTAGVDYAVSGALLKALGDNMPPDCLVIADYDLP